MDVPTGGSWPRAPPASRSQSEDFVCTAHPHMKPGAVGSDLSRGLVAYYTPKHMETLLRRAVATGVPINSLIKVLVNFATTVQLENVHPLQGGILRLKHPSERRPGLPRERAFIFWPRFVWETLSKHAVIIATIARLLCSAQICHHARSGCSNVQGHRAHTG
jgi:hypothetical protein